MTICVRLLARLGLLNDGEWTPGYGPDAKKIMSERKGLNIELLLIIALVTVLALAGAAVVFVIPWLAAGT
jgi:hypothetical protein